MNLFAAATLVHTCGVCCNLLGKLISVLSGCFRKLKEDDIYEELPLYG
jgi:hypothetical protein